MVVVAVVVLVDMLATAVDDDEVAAGDSMEAGWEKKSKGSAFKRTTEVWGFLARCALRLRVANVIFMAISGATIGAMYARGAAKS